MDTIKVVLSIISILLAWRFWSTYLSYEREKSQKFFALTVIILSCGLLVIFATMTYYRQELIRSPIYPSLIMTTRQLKSFVANNFGYLIIPGVMAIIGELFFKKYLSAFNQPKHGPKFGIPVAQGICIGKFSRDVLPARVRKFAPDVQTAITIPYNRLSRGITIIGDMGCGKSRLMAKILVELRKKYPNIPILIHDPKGEWLRTYYDPAKDIIFAPFDNRSASWKLWHDFQNYPELVHPIISTAVESHHSGHQYDRFWTDSAILLLKDIAQQENIYKARGKLMMLKKQHSSDITWRSIYATAMIGFRDLATVELMNYTTTGYSNSGLSIDEFLNFPGNIFLLNNPSIANEQHGSLTLLLTAFMMRVLAGKDVEENDLRAVVIMDEALTFHLPVDVEQAVFTQSRSKGLCVIAAAQRLPKSQAGERGAWADGSGHIFGMRTTDLETRQVLSRRVGEITYEEAQVSKHTGEKKSKSEGKIEKRHEVMSPQDWALENRQFILFHESGITPGRTDDVNYEQNENILVTSYRPRKDVIGFVETI